MATYWENSCSFGLRYVSWYKYLIVSLVFFPPRFWSGNLFLIAPFPDLCLLVPFYDSSLFFPKFLVNIFTDIITSIYMITWKNIYVTRIRRRHAYNCLLRNDSSLCCMLDLTICVVFAIFD